MVGVNSVRPPSPKRPGASQLLVIAATWERRIARFSNFLRRAGNLDCFSLCNLLIFKCWRQIHIFLNTLGAKQKCLQAEFGQWPPARHFVFGYYFPSFLPSFDKYLFDAFLVGERGTVLCTGDKAMKQTGKKKKSVYHHVAFLEDHPDLLMQQIFIEHIWPMHCLAE